eukprot:TRINITY_DN13565_c0_g1_i1.p1 TRINITY_DN13565_c0_g1~~TRINITY_DN13565_c0_g1_i1.p1  ORF type:complete len:222 (-),score=55.62 TRINITY_DN13565_c0_g1_i1:89-703(-)
MAEITPPISPRGEAALRAHKRENQKALKLLGHDPSKSKLKDRLGMTDYEAEAAERQTATTPDMATTATSSSDSLRVSTGRGQKRQRRKSEPMIDKRLNKKALEVLGVDASRSKVQDLLGFTSDAEEEMARSESLQSIHDDNDTSLAVPSISLPPSVNKKEVQKALAVLGLDISRAKASEMLGIVDEPVFPYLEEEFADHVVCTM